MAFSYASFSTPFNGFAANPSPITSAFLGPSLRFSTRTSKTRNPSNGVSVKSSNSHRFLVKSKNFSVYARAAAEKSVHDFTVKWFDIIKLLRAFSTVRKIQEPRCACYRFEILAFPCNQFGGQEPGSNPEIKQFACTRFKAEFPIFDKVDVNGPSTAPIYKFLKSNAGGFLGDIIKWNFEKFLVDKKGKVVERYPPTTSPFQIEKDIQKLLAA